MDFYSIIARNFQDNIETIALSVDVLAEPMERAAMLMTNALLQDKKIMVCGNGPDGALAQLFTCTMLNRFENERPALPALLLSNDAGSITAIAGTSGINDIFSRPVRALGQAGDILLCISSGDGHNNLIRAVQAAHERHVDVIALSNTDSGELSTLIRSEDVELKVNAPRRPRVLEIQTMVIHSLCELIDHTLFDSYTRE
ncbi:MAG: D-sedoheptulose 7-phosphate isomerase [Halioglobus sp.]|jgi:phosphoheptose isomerase